MKERITTTKRKSNLFAIICCVSILIGFMSCKENEVDYHFNELKDGEWATHDTLFFDIDSASITPGIPYDISLEVTNNTNYPYQNIWFFVQDNIDNDSVYHKTEKEYSLADEFGRWKGSGFGALYQTSLSYKKNIVFKHKRNYRIKVLHGMRDEPLEGIEKVGMKISR